MEENQTFNEVRDLIVDHFEVDETTVTQSMTFDDLGADSLDVVEFVMALEDKYEIEFEDDKIENLHNIGDAINYINELRNK